MSNWQALIDEVDAFAKKIGVRDPTIDRYLRQNAEYQRENDHTSYWGMMYFFDGYRSDSTTYGVHMDPPAPLSYMQISRMAAEREEIRRGFLAALDDAAREFIRTRMYLVPKESEVRGGTAKGVKNGDERRGEPEQDSKGD